NLGCFGDGGAIVTNNEQVNKVARLLRNHGSPARNVHSFGFNSRLDDIQASVLSAKLKHIHAWNDLRIKWAARYTAGLKGASSARSPTRRKIPPRASACRCSPNSRPRKWITSLPSASNGTRRRNDEL